ncbi:MAG: hypothetical protein H7124_01325 [Phycisphaerales bacterium]|nr:hypothetical protein [Hyphomonadaceae bacterium]
MSLLQPSAPNSGGRRLAAERRSGPETSGLSALFFLLFGGGIIALATWAAQSSTSEGQAIQGTYGLLVAVTLSIIVVGYGWLHRLSGSVARPQSAVLKWAQQLTAPLGSAATFLDHTLVFGFADRCGAGPGKPAVRAFHFVLYFGTCMTAAVLLPQPWGLIGVFLALFGIFGLYRKWVWVEEDRRSYMLSGAYDVSKTSNLGIGFQGDYRGVALTALALTVVLMPLALMQSAALGFFALKDGGDISALPVFEWFIFFGGEMAKSVPFVDWSEIYGATTITPIQTVHGGGQHMLFFVRAIVDLVLLAGLVQVLELSGRLARQEENFRDPANPERLLDPFLEREAFRDIAKLVVPENTQTIQTQLVSGLKTRLGPFNSYSNRQIRRILQSGEAPDYWLPEHETAAAIILPHRANNQNGAPQYFTRIISTGVIQEWIGSEVVDRAVHDRTQIAAIMSALASTQGGFAEVRELALQRLPRFILSADPVVWSGCAGAIVEVCAEQVLPAETEHVFVRALVEADESPVLSDRSLLLHKALVALGNVRREDGSKPYFDWAAVLLVRELENRSERRLLQSAAIALSQIAFSPGEVLNRAQKSLGDLQERMWGSRWSWRRWVMVGARSRLARIAGQSCAKISRYESV